jgi:hypothetical protein
MEILNKNKFLILCIVGNFAFLYAAFIEFNTLKITQLHIMLGILPLIWQIFKLIVKPKDF